MVRGLISYSILWSESLKLHRFQSFFWSRVQRCHFVVIISNCLVPLQIGIWIATFESLSGLYVCIGVYGCAFGKASCFKTVAIGIFPMFFKILLILLTWNRHSEHLYLIKHSNIGLQLFVLFFFLLLLMSWQHLFQLVLLHQLTHFVEGIGLLIFFCHGLISIG